MEHKTMTVAELRAALAGLDDKAEVLVSDMAGELIAVSGIDDGYKEDGILALSTEHHFPEEWFYEDEDGSRWDKPGV